jgi:hypothetical protein
LGPNKIALTVSSRSLDEEWFSQAAINLTLHGDRINELYRGGNLGPWQTAHVVPPLLRFMRTIESLYGGALGWEISGIVDPFERYRDYDCHKRMGRVRKRGSQVLAAREALSSRPSARF